MIEPAKLHLSLELRERLEQIADASRLRSALYPSPEPQLIRRRSSRQYPGGRPNPRFIARLCRRHQW
ncbi:hypothetical protein [Streptomyces sp. NPDC047525]|uniref:hypothetical protein n=1 Tax=Streptomyces sp. NPDC047525 TaxID=3155264 RepID=UPI0033D3746D